jgi:lauroyl/myristoyl acyltransferase
VILTSDLFRNTGLLPLERKEKIALSNLRIAFPEKLQEERVKIYQKCWPNICKDILETIKYSENGPEIAKKRVQIIGKENLVSCLIQGKGFIALSAHFGNLPLL